MGTPIQNEDTELTEPELRDVLLSLPSYVAGRRSSGPLTAALASNESHEKPLPSVLAAVVNGTDALNRYPDMGAVELRKRISAAIGAKAENIAVGPGSVGVLQQIIAATCAAGDEVIFAWRSFEAYPILVALSHAVAVPVPLRADESHDLDAMRHAITPRTRVLIVCSPNNPTGVTIDGETLSAFIASVPGHVLVVVDEAYIEYVDEDGRVDGMELFRNYGNVCLLRTFSKAYGLAALRVGYAVAHKNLADGLRKVALPFGVNALAQLAAVAALDASEEMRRRAALVVHERRRLTAALRHSGWDIPESQANFIWIRATAELTTALVGAFDKADILVRAYAGDGVRITLADPSTNARVLSVLTKFMPQMKE